MAQTIIEAIQENVDPTTVSNALYELMLEWYGATITINAAPSKQMERKTRRDRAMLERIIGRFIGQPWDETRKLLGQHFKISGELS